MLCEILEFNVQSLIGPEERYNPAMIRHGDHTVLVYRTGVGGEGRLYCGSLGNNFSCRTDSVAALSIDAPEFQSFEDPRFFVLDGTLHLYVTAYRRQPACSRPLIAAFDSHHGLGKITFPVYPIRHDFEKNWIFFEYAAELWATYWMAGGIHHVVSLHDEVATPRFETRYSPLWRWGDARGGTNLVWHDGLMWGFFHSSQKLGEMFKYYMGAYAMEPYPPFRIIRMSRAPLYTPAEVAMIGDRFGPGCPKQVIFPTGLVFEHGYWIVAAGYNDRRIKLFRINHEELERTTLDVSLPADDWSKPPKPIGFCVLEKVRPVRVKRVTRRPCVEVRVPISMPSESSPRQVPPHFDSCPNLSQADYGLPPKVDRFDFLPRNLQASDQRPVNGRCHIDEGSKHTARTSPRHTDYVIAPLFTRGTDPTGSSAKVGVPADCSPGANALASASLDRLYDYMRPWYESLHAHPDLHGLILYDHLPSRFIERWQSPQVAFESYEVEDRYDKLTSVYIQRMALLQKCLASRADIRRVWFTDINDVGFVQNPFWWMDQFSFGESWLFAGEEWTTFRKSEWWTEKAQYLGGEYHDLFADRFADMYLVNAGVWGGHSSAVQEFLHDFMQEVDRLLTAGFDLRVYPGGSADMAVLNLLMYKRFFGRLVTFKLEAHVGQLVFESGAFVRSAGNPIIHHRPAALKVIDELKENERAARATVDRNCGTADTTRRNASEVVCR